MYKLGIDVGGTNTDAVLIDESMNVVAAVKQHTTKDVYGGIMNAVDAVLEESGVDAALINQAMLGTTQCTNAIVERKGLSPIAILRIGAPATEGIPPMVDWEDSIRAVCVDWMIIGLILYLAASGQRRGKSQTELKEGVFHGMEERKQA